MEGCEEETPKDTKKCCQLIFLWIDDVDLDPKKGQKGEKLKGWRWNEWKFFALILSRFLPDAMEASAIWAKARVRHKFLFDKFII